MRIRAKMIIFMTGAILACLVVLGLFILIRTYYSHVDSEVARLTVLADARAEDVERLGADHQARAISLAERSQIRNLLDDGSGPPDPLLQSLVTDLLLELSAAADDDIASISVLDLDGTIVASTDATLVGTEAGDPSAETSDLVTAPAGSTIQLLAFAPVEDEGQRLGTVRLTFSTGPIESLVRSGRFDETGEIVVGLRNTAGDISLITSGSSGVVAALDMASLDGGLPIVRAIEGESAVLTDEVRDYDGGDDVIAVTRPLVGLDGGVVVKIDEDEVGERLRPTWDAIQLMALVLLAFGAVTGLLVGRRIENELDSRWKAESRFTTLFTSAPTAMLLVGEDGRIHLANERATELLGRDTEDLCSMQVEELIPEPMRAGHEALRAGFLDRGMRLPGRDLVALASDGREVPVEISLTPVLTDDRPMVLAAIADLTDRKHSQRMLEERAAALARSNRDLDNFAYVASHDLKAPLRAMDQLASFVLEDAGEVLPEQSYQDLVQVQHRSARLVGLLDGLLQYSRIGRREGDPTWLDTREMLSELAELYVPADSFQVDIPPDLPDVFAPRPAVELVFRNLLMNAVKHHDRASGRIHIDCRTDGEHLVFTVADDGPGIPAAQTEKVFELFQTLHGPGAAEASGMGLTLVKRTIETQGGTVHIVEHEGRGTTVEVRWPGQVARPGATDEDPGQVDGAEARAGPAAQGVIAAGNEEEAYA